VRSHDDEIRPSLFGLCEYRVGGPAADRLADVSIAMGSGSDMAMNSAQVTLVGGDLRGIARARLISNETIVNMRQNLGFAFVYNSLGVPLPALRLKAQVRKVGNR
jgi:cation transport ATPase